MGLFKRLAGLLGFSREEDQQHHDDDAADAAAPAYSPFEAAASATASAQRRGFSVPVQVPVERAPLPPLLVFCPSGDGGVQVCRILHFDLVDLFEVVVCIFCVKLNGRYYWSLEWCTYF